MGKEVNAIHALLDQTPLREHLEQQTDNIAVCTSDREIVFVNNAWRALSKDHGYQSTDFIGQSYMSACQVCKNAERADGEAVYAGLVGVASGALTIFNHIFLCRSATTNRWFHLTAIPLLGTGIGSRDRPLLITHANVTKSIEELTPEFLAENDAQFAHDLKSSLNPLMGFVQLANLAVRELPENDEVLRFLSKAEKYGHHVVNFLSDVIENGRAFGELDDRAQLVNVNKVVESCVNLYINNSSNVSVNFVPDRTKDPTLICPRDALTRIVDNFVSNAVKYNVEDGWVDVTISINRSGGIVVSVEDCGVGIEEHVLPNIFDAYERGPHETSSVDGHGLGLAGTYRLAERFGASIKVESTIGKGSKFAIAFPQWRTATKVADAS